MPPYNVPRRENAPGHLVVDDGEAAVVQMMHRWVAEERLTIRQTLKRLNAGPWRPRSGSPCWSTSVVHHILADPVCVGTAYANRYAYVPAAKPRRPDGPRAGAASVRRLRPQEEWIPIPVPAIVDQETFDRVQAQLARNAALSFRNNTKHTYLLRCLLACGSCGLAMFGTTHPATARQAERRYYKCAGKDPVFSGRGRICTRRSITCAEVDAAVWDHLVALLSEPERLLEQFRHQALLAAEGDAHERAETQRLTARWERLGREDRRLVDAYQAGILSLEELAERRAAVGQRRQAIEEQREQQARLRRERAHAHATPAWYEPVAALLSQMERHGVRYGHLVQINGYFDNSYQEQALARYPGRLAHIVLVDWTRSDAVQQLEALVARGTVSGLRLRPESRSPGEDPLAIWRAAARLRLAITVSGNLDTFTSEEWPRVLAAVPEVPVVMEHLGSLNTPDGEVAPWPRRRQIMDLARFPNAYIKLHGLGEFATRASPVRVPFPFAEPLPPFLDWAYEAFGPQRMMWGSDHSLVSSREGYGLALRLPLEHFAARSEADRRAIFGGTALRVFPLRT